MGMRFFSRVKKAVKAFGYKAMIAASSIALALPAVAAQEAAQETTTIDMSGVTQGIVNLVMALMPVIIVLVIVKALIEAFARMT